MKLREEVARAMFESSVPWEQAGELLREIHLEDADRAIAAMFKWLFKYAENDYQGTTAFVQEWLAEAEKEAGG